MANKVVTDTDRLIGGRIRAARMRAQMSQERLGAEIGVTFQQVQKYEKGTNRVSVGALLRIGAALGVKPADLVPELMEGAPAPAPIVDPSAVRTAELVAGLRLPKHRRAIADMVATFCELAYVPGESGEEALAA